MRKFLLMVCLAAVSAAGISGRPVYSDASLFPVYGKITDDTYTRYERLPGSLEGAVRRPVWNLGRNSAGLYVRFRSDSPVIYLKWEALYNNSMNHMTDTGTKGLDLYALTEDDGWRFVGSARPSGKASQAEIVCGAEEREYMLYLSLYDGVSSLEIGIEEGFSLNQPAVMSPRTSRPVIMYGTSILQGGCASRPGMAHTSILSRRLDREVINLGFSGNALIDYEIAELMASYDRPGVFVLDYVPNASVEQIDGKAEKFFRILRDAHPDVPVVFVELPEYPTVRFNGKVSDTVLRKKAAQRGVYDRLRKAGEKNIYYISSAGMIGEDGEATVDGIHFTDLGMIRYVDHVLPVIRKALGNKK